MLIFSCALWRFTRMLWILWLLHANMTFGKKTQTNKLSSNIITVKNLSTVCGWIGAPGVNFVDKEDGSCNLFIFGGVQPGSYPQVSRLWVAFLQKCEQRDEAQKWCFLLLPLPANHSTAQQQDEARGRCDVSSPVQAAFGSRLLKVGFSRN